LHRLELTRGRLNVAMRALNAISPLATIDRGYAVVTREPGGELLRSHRAVRAADRLRIRVADGSVRAIVEGSSDDS